MKSRIATSGLGVVAFQPTQLELLELLDLHTPDSHLWIISFKCFYYFYYNKAAHSDYQTGLFQLLSRSVTNNIVAPLHTPFQSQAIHSDEVIRHTSDVRFVSLRQLTKFELLRQSDTTIFGDVSIDYPGCFPFP